MNPENAARLLQELFISSYDKNRKAPSAHVTDDLPALPMDRWVEMLTRPQEALNQVFIDRTVDDKELVSIISDPAFPFICFRGTAQSAVPVFVSRDTARPAADSLIRSDNGLSVLVVAIPLERPLTVASDENETRPSVSSSPFMRLISILGPERKEIFYILSYAVFVGIIGLSLPLGVQSLVGFISSGQVVTSAVILVIFILAGIVLSGLMTIFQLEMVERLQQKLFARTAFSFANRVPQLKMEAVLKYYPPELMNRFFDTLTLQKGVPVLLIDLSAAVLQVVFGVILLTFYHPLFIAFGVVLSLLLYIVIRLTGRHAVRTALEESDYKYKVANWLEELARSLSTFKLSGDSTLAIDRTDKYVGGYIGAREKHFRVLRMQYYSFVIFKTVITALLLILGITLIVDRQLNLGQFVAAEIVIILIMNSIEKIILKIDDVYDIMAGVEKISKVTELPVEEYGDHRIEVTPGRGLSLSVQGLSFRYPDRTTYAIDSLDFEVRSGERLCITGSNGSGKSTLIELLLGMFTPTAGKIAYEGVSLKQLHRPSLMNLIGNYVSEDTLFDGTVYDNIVLGRRSIRSEDIRWAIDVAGISEFIDSLPEGIHTRLVGGSARLPESIIHKLIMARNVVERPALLIVDDFLLGVEYSEKRRILDVLMDQRHGWTVLLISNDPMVMRAAERIIFLDRGKLKDQGTFEALSERLGPFFTE
jgi:ABC-type bacteriocin/lantibiotic exporter with double-glycine peptidase domain